MPTLINRKEVVDKLISLAKKQTKKSERKAFFGFITHYFENVSLGDLTAHTLTDLYGAVLSHWKQVSEWRPHEHKVEIFNPQLEKDGWQSTHTIVQATLEDVPFLVDSMRIALSRLGITTHLIVHLGGLKIRHDKKGRISEVFSGGGDVENTIAVAPIYMEVDRQTDSGVLKHLYTDLQHTLKDVCAVVQDWSKMKEEVYKALLAIENNRLPLETAEIEETKAFLKWLVEDHFTFLGCRRYELEVEKGGEQVFRSVLGSGLGVLRDKHGQRKSRYLSELPPEARKLELSHQILIISQTCTRATVHRSAFTAYIIVKSFSAEGQLTGEWRFVGLYTSDVYYSSPMNIPFVRLKVEQILEKSNLPRRGHAARKLFNILETFPRDDLLQGSVDELCDIAVAILQMQERGLIRLFIRKDVYNRYLSCLVYVPRDNLNTELMYQIQNILRKAFNGTKVWFTMYFPELPVARIHYIIVVDPHKPLKYNAEEIENKLIEVGRSWQDTFRENLLAHYGEEKGNELIDKYLKAFPAGYRETFSSRTAVSDIGHMEKLTEERPIEMSFYRPSEAEASKISFKLYRLHETVPLSDALPMLENMGLRVIGERPHKIILKDDMVIWVNDLNMEYAQQALLNVEEIKEKFQDTFRAIWHSKAEDDRFNSLVLSAQLNWREISVLRAYAKYFHQTGFTFSQRYIEATVSSHPDIARLLVEFFVLRFAPEKQVLAKEGMRVLEKQILKALNKVANLDEDRILRRYLSVISATLRTNYFQVDENGSPKHYISLKLDSTKVPGLPLPKPLYEIFVYSVHFEGIHLRTSKVARGGGALVGSA